MTQLERECRVYAQYLSGQEPTPYLTEKYLDFHQKLGPSLRSDAFDSFLVNVSARGGIWVRFADSYAQLFRKGSALRKKLILVLGLLECTPPAFEKLDSVPSGGCAGAVLRMAGTSIGFVLSSLAAMVLFTPARFWISSRER
jgi:hypothetical protein